MKKNNVVFAKKVTPEQEKRSLTHAIRREKAEKKEREERENLEKLEERINKDLPQETFPAWYENYLDFIDDQRNNGLVTVQGTGKYYRRKDGFYTQKGHSIEEARYLFGKKTPAGAIMAAVESGVIQPSDVLVLFDVDRTLINCKRDGKDMVTEAKARGIKNPEEHKKDSIHTTKDMKEILEYMKRKEIPYGYITLRSGKGYHQKGRLAEDIGFNANLMLANFQKEDLGSVDI